VILRHDWDVLDFFQKDGLGCQDRTNEEPPKAAGRSEVTTGSRIQSLAGHGPGLSAPVCEVVSNLDGLFIAD
jgi:hypothetical protein